MSQATIPAAAVQTEAAVSDEAARLSRERAAHNKYFSEGTRRKLDKYYNTIQESRAFYESVMASRCAGASTLEYGCGTGSHSLFLARHGAARVVGIDLSDVAIEKARQHAADRGVRQAEYFRMNAERLEFPDDSFDLICGTAILHHLDLGRALGELARVLRPGGTAVFMEPLGHNPIINLYRRLTPQLRTVDEHPLLMSDLAMARSYFGRVQPQHFGLHSVMAAPFDGRPGFQTLLRSLGAIDRTLFRMVPAIRRYSWQVILVFEQPIKAARP